MSTYFEVRTARRADWSYILQQSSVARRLFYLRFDFIIFCFVCLLMRDIPAISYPQYILLCREYYSYVI
jgi:hypothetical protein